MTGDMPASRRMAAMRSLLPSSSSASDGLRADGPTQLGDDNVGDDNTSHSYTSSLKHRVSCLMQRSAMVCSSSLVNTCRKRTGPSAQVSPSPGPITRCTPTFPIGLLGVLMMMALVLELNLLESSSGSRNQSALVPVFFPDF
ncbi:hypothetical protein EYF80_016915 [Liparis tanakae]|uniref:Uncharacterized protein n=1 Tax=Liparis tanakae TaxID=230148 RepID=A0A4Z2I656_9TELE|nr:hypothetical protein EYF80_016915 [Liparis tanakae]